MRAKRAVARGHAPQEIFLNFRRSDIDSVAFWDTLQRINSCREIGFAGAQTGRLCTTDGRQVEAGEATPSQPIEPAAAPSLPFLAAGNVSGSSCSFPLSLFLLSGPAMCYTTPTHCARNSGPRLRAEAVRPNPPAYGLELAKNYNAELELH